MWLLRNAGSWVSGVRQNLHVYSLYRNPDLVDRIFYCLLASMAAVKAEDVRASFLFMGDLNGHHQEWLGSTTTNRHGVAAFDFSTVSGCDQLVVGPTHARGATLNLLMTDVPDIVRVAIVAPIGNSDHSSLLAVILMAQAVPDLCVSRKVFLNHQVNWNTVCGAIRELPWHNIWLSDNPVEVLNVHDLISVVSGASRICNCTEIIFPWVSILLSPEVPPTVSGKDSFLGLSALIFFKKSLHSPL